MTTTTRWYATRSGLTARTDEDRAMAHQQLGPSVPELATPAVVTNVSDLTPAMREALTVASYRDDDGDVAVGGGPRTGTMAALIRRGLVKPLLRGRGGALVHVLTDAGLRARAALDPEYADDAPEPTLTWLEITDAGRARLAEHLRDGLVIATEAERTGSAFYAYVLSFVEGLEG